MKKHLCLILVLLLPSTFWAESIAPEQPPMAIFKKDPVYPGKMKKAGITGHVTMEFVVNSKGTVVQAKVLSSSRREFERPALNAIKQWRFQPGKVEGRPVNTLCQQRMVFEILPYDTTWFKTTP